MIIRLQRQGVSGSGVKPCNSMAQQQAQEAIEMIRSRLRGLFWSLEMNIFRASLVVLYSGV